MLFDFGGSRFWRVSSSARSVPQCVQLVGLHQSFHEDDLIETGSKEEVREFSQRLFPLPSRSLRRGKSQTAKRFGLSLDFGPRAAGK
jgi:hypothetical protein